MPFNFPFRRRKDATETNDGSIATQNPSKSQGRSSNTTRILSWRYLFSFIMVVVGLDKAHNVFYIKSQKIKKNDRIVVLMGPTGVGKSNFIQSLTTKQMGIAKATLTRGTDNVEAYRLLNHPVWGDRIVLVDTPGFVDQYLPEYSVLKEVRKWMEKGNVTHFDRLLYFENMDSPLSGSRVKSIELFQAVCGIEASHKTCLVTTKWDMSTKATYHKRADEKLQKILDGKWKDFHSKGSEFFKFQNTRASAEEILTKALEKAPETPAFSVEDLLTPLGRMLMGERAYRLLRERKDNLMQEMKSMSEFGGSQTMDTQGDERVHWLKSILGDIDEFISCRALDSYNVEVTNVESADIVILLLGSAASGKSNFIQSLTKVNLNITRSPESSDATTVAPTRHTSAVQAYRLLNHPSHLSDIVLIDTPGFKDPFKSDYGAIKAIQQWLEDKKFQISHILCFHSVTTPPSSPADVASSLELLREACGVEAASRTTLVVTQSRSTPVSEGTDTPSDPTIEKLSTDVDCWKEFCDRGSRILQFTNTPTSSLLVLDTALSQSPSSNVQFALTQTVDSEPIPLANELYQLLVDQRNTLQINPEQHQSYLDEIAFELMCLNYDSDPETESESDSETESESESDSDDRSFRPKAPAYNFHYPDFGRDDKVIILMGQYGSGATTFMKAISAHYGLDESFHNDDIIQVNCIRIPFPDTECGVVLANFPGFGAPGETKEKKRFTYDAVDWLVHSHHQKVPITGVIYMYSILQERFDQDADSAFKRCKALLGEEFMPRTVFCSTGWDTVPSASTAYADKEKELLDVHFRPVLSPFRYDASDESGGITTSKAIISTLLECTGPEVISIYKQMSECLERD